MTLKAWAIPPSCSTKLTLYYRLGGSGNYYGRGKNAGYHTLDFAADSTVSIPADSITERGIEYYIEAIDHNDSSYFWPHDLADGQPPFRSLQVTLPTTLKNEIDANAGYKLISMPAEFEPQHWDTVFPTLAQDLDDCSVALWRIEPGAGNPKYVRIISQNDATMVGPGNALLVRTAGPITEAIPENSKTARTDQPFQIVLSPGWNAFSSPFHFEIPLQNLVLSRGICTVSPQSTVLEPWQGYVVNNDSTVNDTISITPSSQPVAGSQPANGISQLSIPESIGGSLKQVKVFGTVRDFESNPISLARIEVTGKGDTLSDDQGNFKINVTICPPERLQVLISREPFQIWFQTYFNVIDNNIPINAQLQLSDALQDSISLGDGLIARLVRPPNSCPFYMGTTEISNGQYCELLNVMPRDSVDIYIDLLQSKIFQEPSGSYRTNDSDLPVVAVTWYGARAYCRWLSQRQQLNVSLPTVAQWQQVMNSYEEPIRFSHELASVDQAGDSGLWGNVKEWCIDSTKMDHQPVVGASYLSTYLDQVDIFFSPDYKSNGYRDMLTGFRVVVRVDGQIPEGSSKRSDVTEK